MIKTYPHSFWTTLKGSFWPSFINEKTTSIHPLSCKSKRQMLSKPGRVSQFYFTKRLQHLPETPQTFHKEQVIWRVKDKQTNFTKLRHIGILSVYNNHVAYTHTHTPQQHPHMHKAVPTVSWHKSAQTTPRLSDKNANHHQGLLNISITGGWQKAAVRKL